MKKLVIVSVGILALVLQNASAQVLFTTTNDFEGWTPNDGSTVSSATVFDYDNSAVNGGANQSNPGGAGTGGSLSITWAAGNGNFDGISFSPGVSYVPGFLHAIDPGSLTSYTAESGFGPGTLVAYSGTLQMIYTRPDNEGGSYYQLGVIFNYDGHFDFYFPSSETSLGIVDGEETVQVTIPYTIGARPGNLNYFQLGIAYNSDYQPLFPFYVDQIQVVPEPTTMTLAAMGFLVLGAFARRRK